MKKIIIASIILVLTTGFVFSQEQVPGFSNTVYTSVGTFDRFGATTEEAKFLGFVDYFSANVKADGITVAGDIAVLALPGGTNFSASVLSSNFNAVMTPIANLNFAVGTNLDWSVGPKPFSGPDYAAYELPEYAGLVTPSGRDENNNVYAGKSYIDLVQNTFADRAVAVRYSFEDVLQLGFALNDGNETGIGAKADFDVFTLGFAYNGSFKNSNSNIYVGSSIYTVEGFDIDVWSNFNIEKNVSVGGRLLFYRNAFRLIPEVTMTFWEGDTVGNSTYLAFVAEMSITDEILAGINTSLGLGSDPNTKSDSIDGGSRLNIMPHLVWNLTKNHRLSFALNIVNIWDQGDKSDLYWNVPISWKVLF